MCPYKEFSPGVGTGIGTQEEGCPLVIRGEDTGRSLWNTHTFDVFIHKNVNKIFNQTYRLV